MESEKMGLSMEKRIFFTIFVALTVSGFIIICTLGRSVHYHKVQAKLAAISSESAEPLYSVIEYQGGIGVFRRGSLEPYMKIDLPPQLLSEYDREQLRKGIRIYSDEELKQYIEDLSS